MLHAGLLISTTWPEASKVKTASSVFLNIISCVTLHKLKLDITKPKDAKRYKIRLETQVVGTGCIALFSIKKLKIVSVRK
jgi:hypothetical protein